MALIECKEPIYDRQVDDILRMLEDGMERSEIALKLGYKNPVSLDNYMRRRNFSWDSREKNFVPASERYSAKARNNLVKLHGASKVDLIISLFEEGESNAKEIAQQVGLDNHIELANYMKKKGYLWDSNIGNYVKSNNGETLENESITSQIGTNATIADILEKIVPLLKNVQVNNTQPAVQTTAESDEIKGIPRYQLKGAYGTKAMRMANVLDELIKCFSDERNISQREIIEVALIEFFQKYGYKDEVEKCFIE